ncbi:EF-hand domain-containing protein [Aporhodopirellula aestuarii]|uniref:EF-hand domain-containing protein n=1 Tax=Aporhodopirellula aestuarii TaxID=2950107 RepID=A0ABT0UBQ8_9BACT|nr:hypothetical protein [Aporhodopirellula aestuarii]MCM2374309.1 hypothetical protein [Aporhodopirellula aestuarii]
MKLQGIGTAIVLFLFCSISALAWSQMAETHPIGDENGRDLNRYECSDGGRRPGPPPANHPYTNADDHERPPHPLLELFDNDHDGELSRDEIEAATPMLHEMDNNRDGKLTHEELPRPKHPGPNAPPNDRPQGNLAPPRENNNNTADASHKEIDMSKQPVGKVVIDRGYKTDPRDGGRPVKLIAAALGVEDDVFRQAFSKVQPARGGHPTPQRARANKEVLMNALKPHGVTNDRLDEVSNWYRYRPESGELWQHREASVTPVIENGKLLSVRVDNGGAGYISTPRIRVAGFEDVQLKCELEFGEDLESNGRIASITIEQATNT